jgi:type VI secretion system protein ImpJ
LLLLQVVNRYEPLLCHYGSLRELHPQTLFASLVEIAGELATFTARNKRTIAFPEYRHDDLQQCFAPVMADLRRSLSAVIDQTAIQIPIQERQFGIRVAILPDKKLLADASFILAVKADVQPELVRQNFPRQTTVGPVEQIARLVNGGARGIPMRAQPVAPREVPFHTGSIYFELDRTNPLWNDLKNSGGFAFHIGGDFPGLSMEFWAIRK